MRPKPTREWVMLELERLGVRVVSGRLGRGKDDEDDDDGSAEADKKSGADNKMAGGNNNMMGGNNNMGGVSISLEKFSVVLASHRLELTFLVFFHTMMPLDGGKQ